MITPSLCAPVDVHDTDAAITLTPDECRRELAAYVRSLSYREAQRWFRDASDDDAEIVAQELDFAAVDLAVEAIVGAAMDVAQHHAKAVAV